MNAVEAVARAICKSRTCQGVACCQWQAGEPEVVWWAMIDAAMEE